MTSGSLFALSFNIHFLDTLPILDAERSLKGGDLYDWR